MYAVQAARRFTYTTKLSKSDDTLSLSAPVPFRDCTRRDVRSRIRRSWINVICSIIYPGAPRKKVQEYAPESTFLAPEYISNEKSIKTSKRPHSAAPKYCRAEEALRQNTRQTQPRLNPKSDIHIASSKYAQNMPIKQLHNNH